MEDKEVMKILGYGYILAMRVLQSNLPLEDIEVVARDYFINPQNMTNLVENTTTAIKRHASDIERAYREGHADMIILDVNAAWEQSDAKKGINNE